MTLTDAPFSTPTFPRSPRKHTQRRPQQHAAPAPSAGAAATPAPAVADWLPTLGFSLGGLALCASVVLFFTAPTGLERQLLVSAGLILLALSAPAAGARDSSSRPTPPTQGMHR